MEAFTPILVVILALAAAAQNNESGSQMKQKVAAPPAVCDAARSKLTESGRTDVVVTMIVDTSGKVKSFTTDSPAGLRLERNKEAAAAIKDVRLEPAAKNGHPVTVMVRTVFDCSSSTMSKEKAGDEPPASNDAKERVAKITAKIKAPVPVSTPDADFPSDLRAKGIQGTVGMDIVIGVDGKVKNVVVKKSADPRLDAEAIKAVKKWRFHPATKDGLPIETTVYVESNFRIG